MKISFPVIPTRLRIVIGLLTVVLLSSCGGGGVVKDLVTAPKITIDWPSLTRGAQAPTYAGSATISVLPTGATTPNTWTVNRPAGSGAQSIEYTGPTGLKLGPATITIDFKNGPDGSGQTIATASASVLVSSTGALQNSSGGDLGTLTYSGRIDRLYIYCPDIQKGSTIHLIVSGIANQTVVALPQELTEVTLFAGLQYASITGKEITGIEEGNITIHASFETYFGSRDTTIAPPVIAHNRFSYTTTHVAADPVHGKIWATFGPRSIYPNALLDIDFTTGAPGVPIILGNSPTAISVSSDGNTAYVGTDGNQSIQVVNLQTRQVTKTIHYASIADHRIPVGIAINPEDSTVIAVTMKADDHNDRTGPYLFRDGVYATGSAKDGFQSVCWLPGNQYVTVTTIVGSLSLFNITPTSIDLVRTHDLNNGVFSDLHAATPNNIVFSTGQLYSTSDFSSTGRLFGSSFESDLTHSIVWGANVNNDIIRLCAYDLSSLNLISILSLPVIGETYIEFKRYGETGMILTTNSGVYAIPHAPGL